MTRPLDGPDFATDPTLPLPWVGPTRVLPSLAVRAAGFLPDEPVSAQKLSALLGNHGDWIKYLDAAGAFGWAGPDGIIAFDGVTVYPFATIIGGIHYLTRDVFGTDITVNAGKIVDTNGFRLYHSGTLRTLAGSPNGRIIFPGASANSLGPGAATRATSDPRARTVGIGAAGGDGGLIGASGSAGAASSGSFDGTLAAGAGGNGHFGNAGGGGLGGVQAAFPTSVGLATIFTPMLLGHVVGGGAVAMLQGGSGGGGGGATNAPVGARGGGGAAGGGVIAICGRFIRLASAADITAAGGAGESSPGINAGGGGGGGGGTIQVFCEVLTIDDGSAMSAAVNCPGGAGGAGAPSPDAGLPGNAGQLFLSVMGTGAFTAPTPTHREKGVVVMASTGGTGSGYDYARLNFKNPFATALGANAYIPTITPTRTDGGGAIGWVVTEQALDHITVTFTEAFTGQVAIKVEDQ